MQITTHQTRTPELAEAAWAHVKANRMTCRMCGSELRIYTAPLPDLVPFAGDEAKRDAFMASCGPMAACDRCDINVDVISLLRV